MPSQPESKELRTWLCPGTLSSDSELASISKHSMTQVAEKPSWEQVTALCVGSQEHLQVTLGELGGAGPNKGLLHMESVLERSVQEDCGMRRESSIVFLTSSGTGVVWNKQSIGRSPKGHPGCLESGQSG